MGKLTKDFLARQKLGRVAQKAEWEKRDADFERLLKGEISEMVVGETSAHELVLTIRTKVKLTEMKEVNPKGMKERSSMGMK